MNRTRRKRILLMAAVILPLTGVFAASVHGQVGPGFPRPGFPRPGLPGGLGPKLPAMPTPPGFNPGLPGFGKPSRMDSWPFGEYYCSGCNQRVTALSTKCPRCGAHFSNVDAFGRPLDDQSPAPGRNMPPGLNPGFPQPPIANPGAGNPGAALNPPAMPNIGAGPRDVGVPPAGAAPAPNVGGFNAANNPAAVNPFFHNGNGGDSSNLTALWIVLAVLGSMGIVGGIIFAIVRGVSAY